MAQRNSIFSTAWLMACFVASFFVAGLAEAKRATSASTSSIDAQATLIGAWAQASQAATSAYGRMSDYMDSQGSMVNTIGVGAAGAAAVACTLYVASRCLDKDPYLFNNGKLGKLEARSAYTQKKCC